MNNEELNDVINKNNLLIESLNYKIKWNSLREWLEENYKDSQDIWYVKIINKMNELEGEKDNEFEYLLEDYNKLQSNWNILKEKLKKEDYYEIVDYMNELEGKDKE